MHRRSVATILAAAALLGACADDGDDAVPSDSTPAADEPADTATETTAGDEPADSAPETTNADTTETTTETTTEPADTTPGTTDGGGSIEIVAGEPIPDARCEANQAAGTVTYLSGFDFAAAASILEVVVADERGYYDDLCLDVEVLAGGSTANYPLVAANEAQFSSAGSFTELANFATQNDADVVALSTDGHVAIEVLMVNPDMAGSLDELAGQEIGIKFAMPPAVAVMLQQEADLVEGDDYDTVLLEGFDPIAHMAIPGIAAVPGWRSNEPGTLERAGIPIDLYDPSDYGIPGSFGLIYTNQQFLDEHPSAAEDFMRATVRALLEAIDDPAAASQIAVDRINGNGNPMFLSPEGETFRWETDAETIVASTPPGANIAVPIAEELQAQIDAYAAVGFFGPGETPTLDGQYAPDLVAGLYDDEGQIIWPG